MFTRFPFIPYCGTSRRRCNIYCSLWYSIETIDNRNEDRCNRTSVTRESFILRFVSSGFLRDGAKIPSLSIFPRLIIDIIIEAALPTIYTFAHLYPFNRNYFITRDDTQTQGCTRGSIVGEVTYTECILVVPSNDRGEAANDYQEWLFPRTICWFIVTRSLDSFIYIYIGTLGRETYQSGIYFPVGDLCQADPPLVPHVRVVATRASHCRCGIEGFRSITHSLDKPRSFGLEGAKKSPPFPSLLFFSQETRPVRPASRESSRDLWKLLGERPLTGRG